jgi:hypothetical protein
MALTILDDLMSSDRTAHTARAIPGKGWEVSWLPGRHLHRDGAITAMFLADTLGPADLHPADRLWIHIGGWAQELGLDVSETLARTASPPTWSTPEKTAMPADPEAGG